MKNQRFFLDKKMEDKLQKKLFAFKEEIIQELNNKQISNVSSKTIPSGYVEDRFVGLIKEDISEEEYLSKMDKLAVEARKYREGQVKRPVNEQKITPVVREVQKQVKKVVEKNKISLKELSEDFVGLNLNAVNEVSKHDENVIENLYLLNKYNPERLEDIKDLNLSGQLYEIGKLSGEREQHLRNKKKNISSATSQPTSTKERGKTPVSFKEFEDCSYVFKDFIKK